MVKGQWILNLLGLKNPNQLYHWKFFLFDLKNAPVEFQWVMDKVLSSLSFTRCYIDDVIIFNSTP
uniref:Reverse transcriptase domain-containing protein n=1 Tax=Physcomitrium patens TaxID=3218 RepID=A0A2K1K2J4_PHYPA|nr:hypothetical protein PHYPA_012467 [Physcomitrium patens]